MTAETKTASTVPEPFGKPGGPGLWHVKGMELHPYLQHLAHDLLENGSAKSEGQAIRMAWGIIRKWARGIPVGGERKVGSKKHPHVGHIHPDVQAAAAAAVADMRAKQARAHAQHAHEHTGGAHVNTVDLVRRMSEHELGNMNQEELASHYAQAAAQLGKNHPYTQRIAHHRGAEQLGTQGRKAKLVAHLRNVHRLSGSHEHKSLEELHRVHAEDTPKVARHSHSPEIEPKYRREKSGAGLSVPSFGPQMVFDPWGQRIDLATKTVEYPNGTRVIHHSKGKPKEHGKKGHHIGFEALVQRLMRKGKSREEAERIAAEVGRRKYGAKKFQAMSAHGRRGG